MPSNETNAPTPRGPEDEKAGDDRREEKGGADRDPGRPPPPSPLDKPATPDANPIDPRVFEQK